MSGFPIPMQLVRRRRSPNRQPTRDIRINQGDDILIPISLYETEGDSTPLDLTGAAVAFVLEQRRGDWCEWDYGFGPWRCDHLRLVWSTTVLGVAPVGTTTPAAALAAIEVDIPAEVTLRWHGVYDFAIQVSLAGGGTMCVLRGAFHVERLSQPTVAAAVVVPVVVIPIPTTGTGDFSPADFSSTDFNT